MKLSTVLAKCAACLVLGYVIYGTTGAVIGVVLAVVESMIEQAAKAKKLPQ